MKKHPFYKVERRWHIHYGNNVYPSVVTGTDLGHRCGYVGIGTSHPLYKRSYSEHCNVLNCLSKDSNNWQIGNIGIIPLFLHAIRYDEDDQTATTRPDIAFDVHGSITYSDCQMDHPVRHLPYPLWWFGFNCGHAGDGRDLSLMREDRLQWYMDFEFGRHPVRTHEYTVEHCYRLAVQLDNAAKQLPLYQGVEDVIAFIRRT